MKAANTKRWIGVAAAALLVAALAGPARADRGHGRRHRNRGEFARQVLVGRGHHGGRNFSGTTWRSRPHRGHYVRPSYRVRRSGYYYPAPVVTSYAPSCGYYTPYRSSGLSFSIVLR